MIELKFNKGNPPKDGRYICLIKSKGTGFSLDLNQKIPMLVDYICFGNWIYNNQWMLDNPNIFRIHNGKDEVIGWCEFEYKGE